MKLDSEPVLVNGVRFYYTHEKLFAVEKPALGGVLLHLAVCPHLRVSTQTYRGEEANSGHLEAEVGRIYRDFLTEFSVSPPISIIRSRNADAVVIVPDLETTLRLSQFFGSLQPWHGMTVDRMQRGNDPRTLPREWFDTLYLVVPFTCNIIACQAKG